MALTAGSAVGVTAESAVEALVIGVAAVVGEWVSVVEAEDVLVAVAEELLVGAGVVTGGMYPSTRMPKDIPFWIVIYNQKIFIEDSQSYFYNWISGNNEGAENFQPYEWRSDSQSRLCLWLVPV